ncbi:MAG: TonB-dependent receptor plug domain-containing protein, partial [Endomicrobia bacterium]|nr:TonB-dependent receptor plug domain-containing protein [Endomicrobiia bacterium]
MKKINFYLTLLVIPIYIFSEDIFVSVTKEGLPQKFIPSNAIVITKNTIEATNAKNVGELLDILSVYDIARYGTLGSQKTFRLRNSTAEQVLILLNGIPLSGPAKGSFNLSLIPSDVVEKVEILPGSCSALYGANAVAGVVNIITTKPVKKYPTIENSITYGSLNTYGLSAVFDYNRENYGTKIYATNKHSDGWRENSQYDGLSGYTSVSIPVLYGRVTFNILANSSKLGVPGPTPVPLSQWDGKIEKKAYSPLAKQYDIFYFGSIDYEDKFITSKLSLDKQVLEYDNSEVQFFPEHTKSELNTINFLNTIYLPYKFLISFNYNYSQINQQYLLSLENNFEREVSNLGISLQKELKYDAFNLIPTIRWDSNSLFGNRFSPQIIFVYNLYQTKISLTGGTSWRTPTFLDLYWPDQIWMKGNPKLKSEESYSLDFAVEKNFGKVKFLINPFYRYLKNQIRWYPEDPQNLWSAWLPMNIDETLVQGVEIKSHFVFAQIFDNQISVLFSDNRIKKKGEEQKGWQKQAYAPVVTLCYSSNLVLPYKFRLINTAKYVDVQYSKDGQQGTRLDSYLLWNLRVE